MRYMKMLGLLAVSAMALVAFVGTASASASSFTSGQLGAALETTTKVQEVFTITGSEVICKKTSFEGVTEGNLSNGEYHSATQTVHPVYKECEAFGFTEGVNVTTNGCHYTFKAETSAEEMATVNLSGCELSKEHEGTTFHGIIIEVKIPFLATCEVIVPEQSIANAVHYTDTAGSVDVKATAKEIEAIVTKKSGLCPLTLGTHTGENGGTYTGESTVTAAGGVDYTP